MVKTSQLNVKYFLSYDGFKFSNFGTFLITSWPIWAKLGQHFGKMISVHRATTYPNLVKFCDISGLTD